MFNRKRLEEAESKIAYLKEEAASMRGRIGRLEAALEDKESLRLTICRTGHYEPLHNVQGLYNRAQNIMRYFNAS